MTQTQITTTDSTEGLDGATMPSGRSPRLGVTALLMITSFIASAAKEENANAQEPGSKPTANKNIGDEAKTTEVTPAVRATPAFQAGYAEGRLAGRLEGVLDYLKRDIAEVTQAVEKGGTAQEKAEWKKQQDQIEERITNIENGLAGTVAGFNVLTASRDLQADIRVVNTYNLLAARMAKGEEVPQQGPIALPGGKFQLEHGDIVALDIYRKLLQPAVDHFAEEGGLGFTPGVDGAGFENPLTPEMQGTIQRALKGFGDWTKQGFEADSRRAVEKREADRKARQQEKTRQKGESSESEGESQGIFGDLQPESEKK